jgi:uncharacterized DUF497 family protein
LPLRQIDALLTPSPQTTLRLAGATGVLICQSSHTHGRMPMAGRFDWDERKDADNRRKHGVAFGLAREDAGVKVTLSLSRRSVDFFKAEAQRQNCSYQRMIRRLVDSYAARYSAGSRPSK